MNTKVEARMVENKYNEIREDHNELLTKYADQLTEYRELLEGYESTIRVYSDYSNDLSNGISAMGSSFEAMDVNEYASEQLMKNRTFLETHQSFFEKYERFLHNKFHQSEKLYSLQDAHNQMWNFYFQMKDRCNDLSDAHKIFCKKVFELKEEFWYMHYDMMRRYE